MLTKVEVITNRATKLELTLADTSEGFVVQEIGGLDPVSASIVSSSFAQIDGSQYQASRRESRNITLKLGLGPFFGNTARALRTKLYGYLMPKSEVTLRFIMEDEEPVVIVGRVESFESELFTKEPTVNVSILCFDPDFYIPEPVVRTDYIDWDNPVDLIDYEGTIDTGMLFRLSVNRDLSSFKITNTPPDGIPRILEFSGPLLIDGDVLDISTIAGNKYALRTRGGVTTSVLYGVTPFSDWINIQPGLNEVKVEMEYVSGYMAMPYRIEYMTKFGGL